MVCMQIKLNESNFFHYYMFHPLSEELSACDKGIALLGTILLALTFGVGHLVGFFLYDKNYKSPTNEKIKQVRTSVLGNDSPAGFLQEESNDKTVQAITMQATSLNAEGEKTLQSLYPDKIEIICDDQGNKRTDEVYLPAPVASLSFEKLISYIARTLKTNEFFLISAIQCRSGCNYDTPCNEAFGDPSKIALNYGIITPYHKMVEKLKELLIELDDPTYNEAQAEVANKFIADFIEVTSHFYIDGLVEELPAHFSKLNAMEQLLKRMKQLLNCKEVLDGGIRIKIAIHLWEVTCELCKDVYKKAFEIPAVEKILKELPAAACAQQLGRPSFTIKMMKSDGFSFISMNFDKEALSQQSPLIKGKIAFNSSEDEIVLPECDHKLFEHLLNFLNEEGSLTTVLNQWDEVDLLKLYEMAAPTAIDVPRLQAILVKEIARRLQQEKSWQDKSLLEPFSGRLDLLGEYLLGEYLSTMFVVDSIF